MIDNEQLKTFLAISEQGSFERAATKLHISRSAVSQRIRALEETLGAVLLVRDKPVIPTASGEILLRHAKALRLLEASTLREINPRHAITAPLTFSIAVNADSLATWLAPLVWNLTSRKGVSLEIVSDDQDYTFRRLARGEVIGCVASEGRPANGFRAVALGDMGYRCVCTPDFARQHFAKGLSVHALLTAPALLYDRRDALHNNFLQQHFRLTIGNYLRHYVPSPGALLEAILHGGGYGLVPEMQVRKYLRAGALVDLAARSRFSQSLYWHHWDAQLPIVRDITRQVITCGREALIASLVA
jgi:LysR family transcriptional regulator (chromosome initiation inhibitor)